MTKSSFGTKIAALFLIVVGLAVTAVIVVLREDNPFSQVSISQLTLPSRRGNTVQHLRVVLAALQEYQLNHGRLPESLEELEISPDELEDGTGRWFVYASTKTVQEDFPFQDVSPVVSMSRATGHFLFDPEKWRYAIVQSGTGELSIRGWSE